MGAASALVMVQPVDRAGARQVASKLAPGLHPPEAAEAVSKLCMCSAGASPVVSEAPP